MENMLAGEPAMQLKLWGPRSPSLLKGPKYPVCGQVTDVDGVLWDVRDVRITKHGFDLCFGSPDNTHGGFRGGPLRLITTKALRDFWWENRTKGHGFLFDLPGGRTTLKRARQRLRFNQRHDVWDFWTERNEDLAALPPRVFAAKHGVDPDRAFEWRRKVVGTRARTIGWWRAPEVLKILRAGTTLSYAGQQLGIGTSHVFRLRRRAQQESLCLADGKELTGPQATL
jgi:hypothetical protein